MRQALTSALWKTIGVFAVVGPFVGGLFLGFVGLSSGFGGLAAGPFQLEDLLAIFLWGIFGYPFGIIPAVLTGLFAGVISARIPSQVAWVIVCGIAGAIIGSAAMSVLFGVSNAFAFYGGIGGVAALVSALVGLPLRPRRTK